MKLFGNLFGVKEPEGNHYVHKPNLGAMTPAGTIFRRGMWVVHRERVGILHEFRSPLDGEVHLVKKTGETQEVVIAKLDDLRQARFEEIPTRRRPRRERGKQLGYV